MSVSLVLLALALATVLGLGAAAAWASEADMSGMPGMTQEEMQDMDQPAPEADGHGSETNAGPHSEMIGASANWLVIGAFVLVIAGATLAATATKRHLARRMASGELAGAGVLDV